MKYRGPQLTTAMAPDGDIHTSSNVFPGVGVGTFWAHGSLTALDQACLLSFLRRGIDLTLFSYAPLENVPDGIAMEDAATILPEAMRRHVIYNGRPDVCHFSDFFRYELMRQRSLTWVDIDVLMIGEGNFSDCANLLIAEEPRGLNNAIIYISDVEVLSTLREEMYKLLDRDLRWGESGPALVEKVNRIVGAPIEPTPYAAFYPIGYHDIWRLLLPEYFDFCASKCDEAVTVHLFNNIMTKIGYWKDMAPPKGSYLHHVLKENEALYLFSGVYPEGVMQSVVSNYLYRQNGKALGIKAILRELIPSMFRTYRTYYK